MENRIIVTNENDQGKGSLRDALRKIKPDGTIIFSEEVKDILIRNELVIDKSITIESNHEVNIVASKSRIFNILTDMITLKGLTLSDGFAIYGGGIFSSSSGVMVLEDMTITECRATYGGGIYTSGSIVGKNIKIKKNLAIKHGAGIWSQGNVDLYEAIISKNGIIGVSNDNIGAGILVNDGNLILIKSTISRNKIAFEPGSLGGTAAGVAVLAGNLILDNAHIDYNIAYRSVGIFLGNGNITISNNSSVSYNRGFVAQDAAGGGGITINFGNVTISDSEVVGNHTKGMYSGGLVSFLGNVTVTRSTFKHNVNRGPGGAIAANFLSTVTVTDSDLIENSGSSMGGAIVNFSVVLGQVNINRSRITNNELTNWQTVGQTLSAFLKVILDHLDQTESMANSIGGSGASKYIAIIPKLRELAQETNQALIVIQAIRPDILDWVVGGAITTLLGSGVSINESTISQNFTVKKVTDNNPVYGYAGAIFAYLAKITVTKSIIAENIATSEPQDIFTANQLTANESTVGDVYNSGTMFVSDYIGEKIVNTGSLTLINAKVREIESTTKYVNI